AEHIHQDMTGDHGNEQSQPQAERTHHEGDEFDRCDQRYHDRGRAMRHEQREEMQSMAPESDDQHDREAQNGEHAGDAEMAGGSEGMEAWNDPERQQAEEI